MLWQKENGCVIFVYFNDEPLDDFNVILQKLPLDVHLQLINIWSQTNPLELISFNKLHISTSDLFISRRLKYFHVYWSLMSYILG